MDDPLLEMDGMNRLGEAALEEILFGVAGFEEANPETFSDPSHQ